MENEFNSIQKYLEVLKEQPPKISFLLTFEEQRAKIKESIDESINASKCLDTLEPETEGNTQRIGHEEKGMILDYIIKQAILLSEVYRVMMVISAFLVCLSHGSNDVGNAISPLLIIMKQEGFHDNYSFLLGSSGIALGMLVLGKRVMKVVGKDIVVLDFMKGFSSQFSTALCVMLGTTMGLPLSTTHCMIGALTGIFLAGKTSAMKSVYFEITNHAPPDEEK